MAKRALEIDMCSSSQLRDTQGEMLNVEGADISELEAGKGRLNDNHGKGFFNTLGKVLEAKKIFKSEDCDNDRQRYYWEKVKSPYIYVRGVLFDDEDHPNAKACAAILRNIHKTDCPLKVKASVEGGVISRGISDPALLAKTKIHSVALTFVPANQATLVEPLNLDKASFDEGADLILIKSVLHLSQTNVPSFRHITRDASSEKIENNVNQIIELLGSEASLNLKADLIKDSLETKIIENIEKINQLVHAEVESLDKGIKGALVGAALMGTSPAALAQPPATPSAASSGVKVPPEHQKIFSDVAAKDPILGAIGQIESGGATNYNHQPDKNGWKAGGMFGMRPTAAAFVLRTQPELAAKYPDLAEAAKDLNKHHDVITEKFNKDPEAAVAFAKALKGRNKERTRGLDMLIHSWNHGLKGTWDKYKSQGADSIGKDEYVQKVFKALRGTLGSKSSSMTKMDLDPKHGITFSHEHHDLGDGDMLTHIKANHPVNGVVGEVMFEHRPDGSLKPADVTVHPEHRRMGIASAMYQHGEKVTNKKIAPSTAQTTMGQALWAGNAKNPKFGVSKALSAGYSGAGMPTAMSGGSVLQAESQEIGPKSLRYITCDDCGDEQVYGKYQVKCRACNKAFSMAKLESFFRTNS